MHAWAGLELGRPDPEASAQTMSRSRAPFKQWIECKLIKYPHMETSCVVIYY